MRPTREYQCVCDWAGSQLTPHPRQGFGVCPRCWGNGIERIPARIFKVLIDHELRKHDAHAPRWLPWSRVETWREQIEYNHDQTLEHLHERGGLSPAELWCAAHRRGLRAITSERAIDDERALPWLYRMYRGEDVP